MPFAAAFLIEALGWRSAFLVQGLVSLAVMVPLALLVKEPPPSAAVRSSARSMLTDLVRASKRSTHFASWTASLHSPSRSRAS